MFSVLSRKNEWHFSAMQVVWISEKKRETVVKAVEAGECGEEGGGRGWGSPRIYCIISLFFLLLRDIDAETTKKVQQRRASG